MVTDNGVAFLLDNYEEKRGAWWLSTPTADHHDCQGRKQNVLDSGRLQHWEKPDSTFYIADNYVLSLNQTPSGDRVVGDVACHLSESLIARALPKDFVEHLPDFLKEDGERTVPPRFRPTPGALPVEVFRPDRKLESSIHSCCDLLHQENNQD